VGRKFAPISDRMKVYTLVRTSVETKGFTGVAGLRNELKGCGCVLPSGTTLKRWASGETSPFSGKNLFKAQPSEDLSFFLGAWLGDGWADDNDGGKRMLLKVRSYEFAKEFADCATKILGKRDSYWVRRVVDKRGRWYLVKVTSFMLYDFANQPLGALRNSIEPFPRGFLRGFFTAEGNPSVYIQRTKKPRLVVGLCVSNSDYSLLDFTRGLLLTLGYRPGRFKIDRREGEPTNISIATKTLWQLNISRRDDVKQFARTIGFADPMKQTKLEDAIALMERYGSFEAASRWPALYEKRNGYWTKRSSAPPSVA